MKIDPRLFILIVFGAFVIGLKWNQEEYKEVIQNNLERCREK